jgi:DNA-binding transcriptional ArsR family regulator
MDYEADIPRIATLLADPARARILWALIDGTTRPAGELAYAANVSAQSASAHLGKLVAARLLAAQALGRHRYFRIASPEVAALVEGMASLSAALAPRMPRPAPAARSAAPQFLRARTCYGHLAGELAVKLLEAMLKSRWLATEGIDYRLTGLGETSLAELGVDVAAARKARRAFTKACVDLTQRRPHLGGALGDALLAAYVARGWIQCQRRSRIASITPKGHEGFGRIFDV